MAIEKPLNLILGNVNNTVNLQWHDGSLSQVLGFKIKRNGVEIATVPQNSVIVKNGILNLDIGQAILNSVDSGDGSLFTIGIDKSNYLSITNFIIDNIEYDTPTVLVGYNNPYSIITLNNIDLTNIQSLNKITCTNGAIKLIFSTDNGTTWKSWDSVNSIWQTIDINNLLDIKSKANSIDVVNGLTSGQLEQLRGSSTSLKVGHFIDVSNTSIESNNTLTIDYTKVDTTIAQNQMTYSVFTGNKTSYIDLIPSSGVITYEVYAYNDTEQSLVTSNSIELPPATPTNIHCTANGYNITFVWDSISCDGYNIYDENDILLTTTTNNSYIYTNAGTSEISKIIKVSAYNAVGESNKVSATGYTIPNSPSDLILSQSSEGFNLTWQNNSSFNDGFKIQKRVSSGAWIDVGQSVTNSYFDAFTIEQNSLYEYQVCAYNSVGNSAYVTWGSYVVDSVILSYTLEDSLNKITYYWDESIGSTRYKLYITDYNNVVEEHTITGSTNYVFTINKEVNQSAYVVAYIDDVQYGTFASSNSNEVSVKSSPRDTVTSIYCETDTINKIATIIFQDNSVVEDGFKLKYTIDNGIENIVDIPSTSIDSIGTSYSYQIDISALTNNLLVNVAQYNSIGISDYNSNIYIAPPTHIETAYKSLTSEIKVGWIDTLGLADSYRLEYIIDGVANEIKVIDFIVDGTKKIFNATITANPNSQFSGFLYGIINETVGIESNEFTLDCSTYTPPILTSDLASIWSSDGVAEYSWTNDQSELYGYKFIYTINGGLEQVVDFKVSSINIGETFKSSITVYNNYDIISAKIQGYTLADETLCSDILEMTYVELEPLPVNVIKIRTQDGVTLQWNTVEYVDEYEVHYLINNIETIETTQATEWNISIDNMTVTSFEAFVIVKYTGGQNSVPSNYIYITPTVNIQNMQVVIFNSTTEDNDLLGYIVNKKVSNKFIEQIITYSKNTKYATSMQTSSINYGVLSSGLLCELDICKTSNLYFDTQTFYNSTKQLYLINSTSITENTFSVGSLETASCQRGLIGINSLVAMISNKKVQTPHRLSMAISNLNLRQANPNLYTTIFERVHTDVEPIHVTVYNKLRFDAGIYTEIHKIRICCLGDSITAGHPNYWAENEVNHTPNSGSGNIKSQYEYWLQRRLQDDYEVINNGYGSDTTERMLNRFDSDILPLNPQYCVIQGGTNDINWAMVQNKNDQPYLDAMMETAKQNLIKIIDKCIQNNIVPILGTLIPRTSAQGIYREALWNYNEWIINYCNGRDDLYYADFYNAGKDNIPPTPLEEPSVAGNLNPLYDGDSLFDQYGNLTRRGYGVHPNVTGYKIMADAIPLNVFKSLQSGIKLYMDENCTSEENAGNSDIYHSEYDIVISNLDRGRTKIITRYIKNIGSIPTLFSMYNTSESGVDMTFSLDGVNYYDNISSKLDSGTINAIYIKVVIPRIGELPKVLTILSTRSIKLITS